MKILITGASSYVGARLYYDLENKFEVIGTYFNNKLSKSFLQMNLTDNSAVRDLFKSAKPNMIVHVANFSSPRSALNNEKNFIELNDKTTKYIIQNANIIGSKVVFISSQAANSPDNIYGKLKQKSETEVASCNAGYLILRPSLIVGFSPNTINPRPFNKILTCLDNKDEKAEFDTSWKLQPSYIGHLSQVIDKTIQSDKWNLSVPVLIDELVTQYQIASDVLVNFSLKVNEVDQGINIPPSKNDLSYFNSLNLYPFTYRELINVIVDEINNRAKFTLK